jgi:transcriptional regulator with XRE-family HTH domain
MGKLSRGRKTNVSYAWIVGHFIRLERTSQCISLFDFAKRMHIGISGWSRVETGNTTISVEQLKKACDALEILPSELLARVERYFK